MSADEQKNTEFKVVTGEKEDTLIVLLFGQIRAQEVVELDNLLNFLLEKPNPAIIISFRDVIQFMPGAHGAFARIQATLRKQGKLLTICSFKPEIKTLLLQAGVVRESEMFNNIPDAWHALKVRLLEASNKPVSEKEEKKEKSAA